MNAFNYDFCPICKLETEVTYLGNIDILNVRCIRCGDYGITRTGAVAIAGAENRDPLARVKMSYWIRHQTDIGLLTEIGSQTIREIIENTQLPTPLERSEILLKYLGDELSLSSDTIEIKTLPLGAKLGAEAWGEIDAVIIHLAKQDLIEFKPHRFNRPDDYVTFGLTIKGWEHTHKSVSTNRERLAAIVFTDIVGYTQLSAEDDEKAQQFLMTKTQIVKPLVEKHGGKVVKGTGDGFLLCFDSSSQAVRCCIEIQQQVSKQEGFHIRIGIHQGDVLERDDDLFGTTVNLAQRIESIAPSGGVAISDKVRADISSKPELEVKSIGEPDLKGITSPMEIFIVTSPEHL